MSEFMNENEDANSNGEINNIPHLQSYSLFESLKNFFRKNITLKIGKICVY
jgi:hypothetical protein